MANTRFKYYCYCGFSATHSYTAYALVTYMLPMLHMRTFWSYVHGHVVACNRWIKLQRGVTLHVICFMSLHLLTNT